MSHRGSIFALLAVLAVSTGCKMCASPYDYCGPVFGSDSCAECYSDDPRRGSILAGGGCSECGPDGCEDAYHDDGATYSEDTPVEAPYEGEVIEPGQPEAVPYTEGSYSDETIVEEGPYEWEMTEPELPAPPATRQQIEEAFDASDDSASLRPIPDPRTSRRRGPQLRR